MLIKPRVGILTTFTGADFGYSLVSVVNVQIQMLIRANYDPILFVAPSFHGEGYFSDKIIEIRRHVDPDTKTKGIIDVLRPIVSDVDVMFCHDLMFLGQHTEWADALRVLAVEFPHIAWLHWQHSRGDHAPIDPMERSWYCYPNKGDLVHVAQLNSVDIDHVCYIPHPLDIKYMGWPELAIQIAEDYGFPFTDISMVMPARLDRQKQIEKLVRVFAGLKLAGRSVCLLIADAFATGDRFLEYKKECLELAKTLGLIETEFAFLGERYEQCIYSTPRDVVKALFEMSNLFIQPSTAETSSLVVMEAAMAGNLVIINSDFKPIHHLYKKALTLPFGSVFEDTKYFRDVTTSDGKVTKVVDNQLFWTDRARDTIIPVLDTQLTLQVKRQQLQERWPSKVFNDYLEPLILQVYEQVGNKERNLISGDPEITAIITTMDNLPILKRQIPILSEECGRIIVVDQDSKDGTREWLDEQDGITVIHRKNNGAGPGRNTGLAEWDKNPTPYTLMVDGGILPPHGGVKLVKSYLILHPEVDVISPELLSCYTTDESLATLRVPEIPITQGFPQRCLSSTAYALCRASAWVVRFCEDGPFGEPGWGVDDNEMAFRWDDAEVLHHDFTNSVSGWLLYRHASGSFQRLFAETGVWPNQYGSVYEKRCVKAHQDWRAFYSPSAGWTGIPTVSYIISGIPMPDFAKLIKTLHVDDVNAEVLASDYDPEVKRWLDTFAMRWPWGDCTFDPDGKKLARGKDYPEELWTGNVVRNRGPLSPNVVTITEENLHGYLADAKRESVYASD